LRLKPVAKGSDLFNEWVSNLPKSLLNVFGVKTYQSKYRNASKYLYYGEHDVKSAFEELL